MAIEPFGDPERVQQRRTDAGVLAERVERELEQDADVDGRFLDVAARARPSARLHGLLEERDRLVIRGAMEGALPGAAQQPDRLLPHLRAERVVREHLDVLLPPLGDFPLDRVGNAPVEGPALVGRETEIRDLAGDGVPERIPRVRAGAERVHELRMLQAHECRGDLRRLAAIDRGEQRARDIAADHGGRPQQLLVARRELLDA